MPAQSADTTALTLSAGETGAIKFALAAPGVLRKLDLEGKPTDSKLPHDLRRTPAFAPVEARLTLRGNYFFAADAGVFTDCATGLRWPVAPGGGAGELEKSYVAARGNTGSAGTSPQPLIVSLDPKAPFTLADRKAEYDAAMHAHALFGRMSDVVDRLNGYRALAAARARGLPADDAVHKDLDIPQAQLETRPHLGERPETPDVNDYRNEQYNRERRQLQLVVCE